MDWIFNLYEKGYRLDAEKVITDHISSHSSSNTNYLERHLSSLHQFALYDTVYIKFPNQIEGGPAVYWTLAGERPKDERHSAILHQPDFITDIGQARKAKSHVALPDSEAKSGM
jgi:hypothetical protein